MRNAIESPASIARRIGLIPTLRLTVIIRARGGAGSGRAHGDPTAHGSAIDVVVVNTAVMAAHVTRATTAAAPERECLIRDDRDTRDAKDGGHNERDNGPTGHDGLLSCAEAL